METTAPIENNRRRSLSRYERQPDAIPALSLQERDYALLRDLWQHRWLTTSQLALLRSSDPELSCRFVSRLPLTRRLKLLYHHRYVQRIPRPLAKGSLEPVYLLDSEGARVLSLRHGEVTTRAATPAPKSLALDHLLAINQLRVSLAVASHQRDDVELLNWLGSDSVKFTTEIAERGERVGKVTLIPDGFFTLKLDNHRLFFFVEVDLGTEPGRTLADKCRAYFAYWRTGGFAAQFNVPTQLGFRVLFVAPTSKRCETIVTAIRSLETGHRMFWTTLQSNVTPETLLQTVFEDGATGAAVGLAGSGG